MSEPAIRSSPHYYIIDDDRSFCMSLKLLLNAQEFAADYFESAQSFLDSVSPQQPGVAIIDIHMPECDGFELADKMKELQYVMPFIIVSGQGQDEDRALALQKGAVGFLQKPFSNELLHGLLVKALKGGNN